MPTQRDEDISFESAKLEGFQWRRWDQDPEGERKAFLKKYKIWKAQNAASASAYKKPKFKLWNTNLKPLEKVSRITEVSHEGASRFPSEFKAADHFHH